MRLAYSYTRFSTPEQAAGDSARRQIELAEAYAAKHKLRLDNSLRLRDEGISGFRGANVRRGALGQFLQAIDDGHVPEGAYLLVESLDRVSRQNPWDALPIFQQIINAGVIIVTLFDGKTYERDDMRANPLKIMESLFVMIRANEESETKSRRLKAAWGNKRKGAGERPLTAIVPSWMRKAGGKIELIEERATVVRQIVELALSGWGQHRIAERLNREKVPVFGRGTMWHRSYVKKIIESPALIGTLVPHELDHSSGKRVRRPLPEVPGYYPAVVLEQEWAELQALGSKRRPQQRSVGVQNILAGLAKCGRCGSSMVRVQKGRKSRPSLVCSRAKGGAGCEYKSVPMVDVEMSVRSSLWSLAQSYPTGDDRVDKIADQLQSAEVGLQHIIDELIAGGPNQRLTAARIEQQALVARLDGELKEAVASSRTRRYGRPERLEDVADDASAAEVNLILRGLYRAVTVHPGSDSLSLEYEPI